MLYLSIYCCISKATGFNYKYPTLLKKIVSDLTQNIFRVET